MDDGGFLEKKRNLTSLSGTAFGNKTQLASHSSTDWTERRARDDLRETTRVRMLSLRTTCVVKTPPLVLSTTQPAQSMSNTSHWDWQFGKRRKRRCARYSCRWGFDSRASMRFSMVSLRRLLIEARASPPSALNYDTVRESCLSSMRSRSSIAKRRC